MAKPYTTPERIKGWRTVSGLSIRRLAAKSGVCRSPLHLYEQGKAHPHERHVQAIARACGVTMVGFYDDAALTRALAAVKSKKAAA